jgi:lipopolysaccharide transport system permease protein
MRSNGRSAAIPLRAPRRLHQTRDLLATLVTRDFRARYTDSLLGLTWAVINPLAQLGIYYLVFQHVLSFGIRRYSSFAFIGIVTWAWFSTTITASVRILKNNREMVEQPGFPALLLPVVAVMTSMLDFMIALPILVMIVALEGAPVLGFGVLALPVVMAVQFAFVLGLALLIAGLVAVFRDLQHVVAVFLQLYFFLTPIFYQLEAVPEAYRLLFLLNPMVHIVEGYRSVLMHAAAPEWTPLLLVAAFSCGTIAVGASVYQWARYWHLENL